MAESVEPFTIELLDPCLNYESSKAQIAKTEALTSPLTLNA
jgi:hypothetical protein